MVVIPAAEVDVDEPLVRRLLTAQAPHLADRPLALATHGWDRRSGAWATSSRCSTRRAAAAPLTSAMQRFLPRVAS